MPRGLWVKADFGRVERDLVFRTDLDTRDLEKAAPIGLIESLAIVTYAPGDNWGAALTVSNVNANKVRQCSRFSA